MSDPELDPDPLVRGTYGSGDPDPHQNVSDGSPTLLFRMTFFVLNYFIIICCTGTGTLMILMGRDLNAASGEEG